MTKNDDKPVDGVKELFNADKRKHNKKSKLGVVKNITPTKIILDVNGNGQSIPFDSFKHADVKVGDNLEV